jgi:hypothetical protein
MCKAWIVEMNTGKRADLLKGSERTTVKRPKILTVEQFYDLLRPGSYIVDGALTTFMEW